MIAIPLTSFVVMPAEAAALLLDAVGLGAPAWWIVSIALKLLLGLAHLVGSQPYATTSAPATGGAVFVMTMLALLWMMLWRGRIRWLGAPIACVGLVLTLLAPAPDILVTTDGRHVAVRTRDGGMALLRERAGDYVRTTLSESAGFGGDFTTLSDMETARCSRDLCAVEIGASGGKSVSLLVTRSTLLVPYKAFVAACARADIVIADRTLPQGCTPGWIKLDRRVLNAMGGARIMIEGRTIIGGRDPLDRHPWIIPARVIPPSRGFSPAARSD
jgi:competence protein ComEC